ncbi:hypothetical protein D3C71_1947050 [compost metagenome]
MQRRTSGAMAANFGGASSRRCRRNCASTSARFAAARTRASWGALVPKESSCAMRLPP